MNHASPFAGWRQSGPTASRSPPEDVNTRRFAELKPICVQLLGLSSSVERHDDVHQSLRQLADRLSSFPRSPPLSPALISYVFFPLAQLLRALPKAPDRIEHLRFVILARLADDWWPAWIGVAGKEDEQRKVWEQLVVLAAMALGKEGQSEETTTAIVCLLQTLFAPRSIEQQEVIRESEQQWEWDGETELPDIDDYEREMQRIEEQKRASAHLAGTKQCIYPDYSLLSFAKTSLQAQVLVKALDLARSKDSSRGARTASLRLARTVLHVWVARQTEDLEDLEMIVEENEGSKLASGKKQAWAVQVEAVKKFLPGVVSATMRILTDKNVASSISTEALHLLRFVLITCLADGNASGHVSMKVEAVSATLEELVERAQIAEDESTVEHNETNSSSSNTRRDDMLDDTVVHVATALRAIIPIASHENGGVQRASARLTGDLLLQCHLFCDKGDVEGVLVDCLLDLASKETASQQATTYATKIFRRNPTLIERAAANAAQSLPRLLFQSRQDAPLLLMCVRFAFLVRLMSGAFNASHTHHEAMQGIFSPKVYQHWLLSILGSFTATSGHEPTLVGFETRTSQAFMRMIEELGAAAARWQLRAGDASISITPIVEYPLTVSGTSSSVSSNGALVAARLMIGIARVFDDGVLSRLPGREGTRKRKQAKAFARQIVTLVTDAWQASEEAWLLPKAVERQLTKEERDLIKAHSDPHDRLVTEYQRGVGTNATNAEKVKENELSAGSMLDVNFVKAASLQGNRGVRATNVHDKVASPTQKARQTDALLLSTLASAATVLGPAVKPYLVQTIYPAICAVASTSDDLRTAATSAVQVISYAAGYASVQGCLLDHADFILGAATHRLISTLAQELQRRNGLGGRDDKMLYTPLMSAMSAPLVLVELIRMVGSEVVVLVEDAIDEVLEAIDRFHAHEETCDSLLSVLDRMLEVILSEEKSASHNTQRSAQMGYQPENERDFAAFEEWSRRRTSTEQESDETPDESAPTEAASEKKATQTQATTVSMLKKAVPFLSHSSRTIRMRCLRLLNRGVELLCRQGATVEPLSVVNACWPILMARLGFSMSRPLPRTVASDDPPDEKDFFVAIEAVKLVGTLARFLIDFIGNEKMLRQAIPRILLLLRIVEQAEQTHGQQGQKATPTTFLLRGNESDSIKDLALPTQQTLFRPFRPHSPLAILLEHALNTIDTLVSSMGAAITEADLFTFAAHPTLLACLDVRQCDAIHSSARHFYYTALTQRNASLVWLIISGAKAQPPSIFPAFLSRPELSL